MAGANAVPGSDLSGRGGAMQIAEPSTPRPLADCDIGETLRAYFRSGDAESEQPTDGVSAERTQGAWSLEPVRPAVAEESSRAPASGAAIPGRDAARDAARVPIGRQRPRAWRLAGAALLIVPAIGALGYLAAELRAPLPIARGLSAAPGDAPQAARTPQPIPEENIPGLPRADAGAQKPPAERSVMPTPRGARDSSPDLPASNSQSVRPRGGNDAPNERRIEGGRAARVPPRVVVGYDAFRSREIGRARGAYQEALQEDPLNRDALLGMAAIETYAQRRREAQAYVQSLLRADPRDPHARAALIALRLESTDSSKAQRELEGLLSQEPESAALQFVLGNQYARQRRWAEARQVYLRALHGDPGDPDIAFNLAIACDHLGLASDARAYYERALDAASRRMAVFPADAAQRRLGTLAR